MQVTEEVDELHTFVINEAGLYAQMQTATQSDGNDLDPEYQWVLDNLEMVRKAYDAQFSPTALRKRREVEGW